MTPKVARQTFLEAIASPILNDEYWIIRDKELMSDFDRNIELLWEERNSVSEFIIV